eukprot:1196304-Prorocentrum_minimum.AAC.1
MALPTAEESGAIPSRMEIARRSAASAASGWPVFASMSARLATATNPGRVSPIVGRIGAGRGMNYQLCRKRTDLTRETLYTATQQGCSHDGPIRRRTRAYILTRSQSDAGRDGTTSMSIRGRREGSASLSSHLVMPLSASR